MREHEPAVFPGVLVSSRAAPEAIGTPKTAIFPELRRVLPPAHYPTDFRFSIYLAVADGPGVRCVSYFA